MELEQQSQYVLEKMEDTRDVVLDMENQIKQLRACFSDVRASEAFHATGRQASKLKFAINKLLSLVNSIHDNLDDVVQYCAAEDDIDSIHSDDQDPTKSTAFSATEHFINEDLSQLEDWSNEADDLNNLVGSIGQINLDNALDK